MTVTGVRFAPAGKIYYFDPGTIEVKRGDHVIVKTVRGTEYGTVAIESKKIPDEENPSEVKRIIRVATEADEARNKNNREKEERAYGICKKKIAAHGLEMKLVKVEYTFDNSKILFYFTADGRVDFRDLVKDLAGEFHTRIELRQIGVRDAAKMIGGIGNCGRELCCSTFLCDFAPVSVKMAKEQNISLNPVKISGVCGRLMCCLQNEQEAYEYLNSKLPSVGDVVTAPDGASGKVQSVNVLRQRVKIVIEEGDDTEVREYAVEEINFTKKKKKENAAGGKAAKKGGKKNPDKDGKKNADRVGKKSANKNGKKGSDENGGKGSDENDKKGRGESGKRKGNGSGKKNADRDAKGPGSEAGGQKEDE